MNDDAGTTSLQLDQDPAVQQREWRFERGGRILFAFLVVAALFGLFGDGPLARAHGGASGPGIGFASVDYERIVRTGASTVVSVTVPASTAADTMADLAIDRRYLEAMDVSRITPEPVETRASTGWLVHRFRRVAPGTPLRVDLSLAPISAGRVRTRLLGEFGALDVRQLVLP